MNHKLIELSNQEEIERKNQSKLRKRQSLVYIEEESNFKEDIENEFV